MNRGLQIMGGVAALATTAIFLFVFALVASFLAPMAVLDLGFGEYLNQHRTNGMLIYVWHFSMYLAFGLCLVVMAVALHERLKAGAPAVSLIALSLGLIYATFVFLGGLLTIHGDEAVLSLAARDVAGAEGLRRTLTVITLCVDSADRFLGCLWIGLVSVAAIRTKVFPRGLVILGLVIGLPAIVGMAFPSLLALSYVFGLGIIGWSAWLGIWMLRGKQS